MSTAAAETPAQWNRRLRQEPPTNAHFIDAELLPALEHAAAERGITRGKLVKTILAEWIQREGKG
jgi:hypothetical protein